MYPGKYYLFRLHYQSDFNKVVRDHLRNHFVSESLNKAMFVALRLPLFREQSMLRRSIKSGVKTSGRGDL